MKIKCFVLQVTLGADGYGGTGPKTKRRKASVERQKSRAGSAEIYIPPSDQWPVNIVSLSENYFSKKKSILISQADIRPWP